MEKSISTPNSHNFILLVSNDPIKKKAIEEALWNLQNNKNSDPVFTDKFLKH